MQNGKYPPGYQNGYHHPGYPPNYSNTPPTQKKSPTVLILVLCIVLAVVIFAGIWGMIYLSNESEPAAEKNATETSAIAAVPETVTVQYVAQWPAGVPTDSDIYMTYSGQPATGGDASTLKHVGYIYWHWCRGELIDGPINRTTGLVMSDRHDTFHAYFSTERPDISGDHIYDGRKWVINPTPDGTYHHPHACCTDTYWFYVIDVWEQDFVIEEE